MTWRVNYTNQNSRCGIVLEDGGAPKPTPILTKRIYPSLQGSEAQSLNESRSISCSCGTRRGLSLRADGEELKNSLGRTAALTVKAIPTASCTTIRLRSAPPSHLFLSAKACILQLKPGRPFSMQLLRPKRRARPQSDRYLGECNDQGRMSDRQPSGVLTTAGLLSGVKTATGTRL